RRAGGAVGGRVTRTAADCLPGGLGLGQRVEQHRRRAMHRQVRGAHPCIEVTTGLGQSGAEVGIAIGHGPAVYPLVAAGGALRVTLPRTSWMWLRSAYNSSAYDSGTVRRSTRASSWSSRSSSRRAVSSRSSTLSSMSRNCAYQRKIRERTLNS